MDTFSGNLTNTAKSTGGVTWTLTASYVVTPSSDLSSYSVAITLKAKRTGWGNSYNNQGTSYLKYTVNGNASSNTTIKWSVTGVDGSGGGEVTLGTYTYNVSGSSVNLSTGIPITVYWYTGILNNEYTPAEMSVTGSIAIPDQYAGVIYIDNGSSWNKYAIYIDNGSSWDRYIPYIDNGSSWDICS